MRVFLETQRLVLREFTVDDVDALVELDSDPEVARFVFDGEVTTRESVLADTLPAFLGYYQRFPGYGFWAAIEKSSGDFLGWFHFRPRPGNPVDEPELGYRLRRSAWGKGYATEGSRALIDKGFTEFGVARVVAEAMVVHTASRRVMEKSGMRLLRVFHVDWPVHLEGAEHGDVEYGLTRDQWTAGRLDTGIST